MLSYAPVASGGDSFRCEPVYVQRVCTSCKFNVMQQGMVACVTNQVPLHFAQQYSTAQQ